MFDKKKEAENERLKIKHMQQEKIQAKIDFLQLNKPNLDSKSSHSLFFDKKLLEGIMENNMG
jgi:hypothetical protein